VKFEGTRFGQLEVLVNTATLETDTEVDSVPIFELFVFGSTGFKARLLLQADWH